MPNRCARCDAFAGRGREMPVPGEWLSYLQRERDVPDPVGTLKMPLCTDCYAEVEEIRDGDDPEEREALLEAIHTDRLVDER
jgi:hypothetical protein